MTMDQEAIEKQIREVLATEKNAIPLSNKLVSQGGLFGQLGPTYADRQQVVRSPLFKEAQARVRELEKREAKVFAEAARLLEEALPKSGYRLRLEWIGPR